MAAEVLSGKQIKALKDHKYSSEGSSICEAFMQVYWRWLVEQIPLTWAPNMITLVGLLVNIVTTLALLYYSPDGLGVAPRLAYVACGVGLFIYQSLDAIDGKQARRTKTNTPLGELFDHGCDSLSTVFVMIGCCAALRLGQNPNVFLFEVCLSEFCFYMAHWQTYVTGSLKFGSIDVTEGQFTVIVIYTLCAINPLFFDNYVPLTDMPLRFVCVLASLVPSTYYIIQGSGVILRGGVGKNKSTVAGSSTIFPIVPIGLITVLQVIIANKTTIYTDHPTVYLIGFGLVASKITNKLVVAHMTKSEMHLMDSSLLGPMMLFLNQYFNCIFPESWLLYIMLVYSAQDWLKYSTSVCDQICHHLNISCFSITPPTTAKHTNSSKSK